MSPKCTNVIVLSTFDDGTTTSVTYPEPEIVESETDIVEEGEYYANSLYAFDYSVTKRTLSIISGERGCVTVSTPAPRIRG